MQKAKVTIRTRYDERSPFGLRFSRPSRVKQEFRAESDINVLVKRFLKTGQLPQPAGSMRFGDFSNVTDYQDVMNRVISFEEEFQSLPAEMRQRFGNNPAELLQFLAEHPAEAVKLGLLADENSGNSNPLDVTVPVDTNTSPASQEAPPQGGESPEASQ